MLKLLGWALALSTELVLTSAAGFLLGYGLDRWLGIEQRWMTVGGGVLGMGMGFYRVYRQYRRRF